MRALLVLPLCVFAACGGPAAKPVTGNFPLTVGPAGGTIEGTIGTELEGVKLEIPAGALTTDVTIDAIVNVDEPVLGPGAHFVGVSADFLPRAQTFAKPVKLTMTLFPDAVAAFTQTPADCLMWLRAADETFSQAVPTAFTDDTVTVETSTLVQAAVGVKSVIAVTPPHPLVRACTEADGFCVSVLGTLKNGANGFSKLKSTRMQYRYSLVDAGVRRTFAVEHDVALGRDLRESAPLVHPATTPIVAANGVVGLDTVVLASDDSVWGAVTGGYARFPFTGAPTYFPDDANGRTVTVAFTADGKRHRLLLKAPRFGAGLLTMRTLANNVESPAITVDDRAPGGIPSCGLPLFPVPPTSVFVEQKHHPFEFFEFTAPPAAPIERPVHPLLQEANRNMYLHAAVSADGLLLANELRIAGSPGSTVFVQSRDGTISRAFALPRLNDLEFGETGFLYAAAEEAAHVYRLDLATGGIQTIELSASTDTAVVTRFIPQAIRHVFLPPIGANPAANVIFAVIGESPDGRRVALIKPAN